MPAHHARKEHQPSKLQALLNKTNVSRSANQDSPPRQKDQDVYHAQITPTSLSLDARNVTHAQKAMRPRETSEVTPSSTVSRFVDLARPQLRTAVLAVTLAQKVHIRREKAEMRVMPAQMTL